MNAHKPIACPQTLFATADPLTAFFARWSQIGPWFGMILYSLAINIPILVVAWVNNLWTSQGPKIGLLYDYRWWAIQLTSVPATMLFFLWLPNGIRDVFDGLTQNQVLVISNSQDATIPGYEDFIRRFDKSYRRAAWLILSILSATVFVVAGYSTSRAQTTWVTSNEFLFWWYGLSFFSVAFIVSLLIIRGAIVILWFNRLFSEFRVNVNALHPDGVGGLAPLGNFSVKVGYLIGVYGIAAVASSLTQSYVLTGQFSGLVFTPSLVLAIIAYFTLAPIAFFAPIAMAHTAMRSAKEEFILRIADQFHSDFAQMESVLNADATELKKSHDKLESLQKLHKMASGFPVWPFDVQSLARFFLSFLSPFLLTLITELARLVIKMASQ